MEQAQKFAKDRQEARQQRDNLKQQRDDLKQQHSERRERLQKIQAERRADLGTRHERMQQRHTIERATLIENQKAANQQVLDDRQSKQSKGLTAFIARITGFTALKAFRHRLDDKKRTAEHTQQRDALARKHEGERRDIERREPRPRSRREARAALA